MREAASATEIERIDNEADYRPESFPSELEAINRWGLLPPEDFLELGIDVPVLAGDDLGGRDTRASRASGVARAAP